MAGKLEPKNATIVTIIELSMTPRAARILGEVGIGNHVRDERRTNMDFRIRELGPSWTDTKMLTSATGRPVRLYV